MLISLHVNSVIQQSAAWEEEAESAARFFMCRSKFIFMKIESWQLSNLLKARFESEIQSALHNPVNGLNAGALRCRLMTQRSLKGIVSSRCCCCFFYAFLA